MEREDVPPEVIEEYKKSEILRKSMAVVKKHAKKMRDIRTSPERYDRVQGKVKTKNPYTGNLSVYQTKNGTSTSGFRSRQRAESPFKMDPPASFRPSSPRKREAGDGDEEAEDWYRPDIGEIPYAPLTRANREKIAKRDAEIAAKEAELTSIMEQIEQRKLERAQREAEFKQQTKELRKKRKHKKGADVEGD